MNQELPDEVNVLTSQIINAAMEVHTELGPGLYEKVYRRAMTRELVRLGVAFEVELPVPIVYKGELIDDEGYRLDLLVDDTVVVELKSVEAIVPVHKKQVLTYLRLKQKPVGLLINFNVEHLRNGISRIIDPRRNLNQPRRCQAPMAPRVMASSAGAVPVVSPVFLSLLPPLLPLLPLRETLFCSGEAWNCVS